MFLLQNHYTAALAQHFSVCVGLISGTGLAAGHAIKATAGQKR